MALCQDSAGRVVHDLLEERHALRRIIGVPEDVVVLGYAAVRVIDGVQPMHPRLQEDAELELVRSNPARVIRRPVAIHRPFVVRRLRGADRAADNPELAGAAQLTGREDGAAEQVL